MALDATITGDTPSASTVPTKDVSEYLVDGSHTGTVYLEMQKPSGDWHILAFGQGRFSGTLLSPDYNLLYRFRPENVVGNAEVWFGP